MTPRKVVALAGGTGSAKLLRGLAPLGGALTVVSNVGDNVWVHGLYVCPDLDTAMYTLAGVANRRHGWGIEGDTFAALAQLESMGEEAWFALGDRDLATHIVRTEALRRGRSLTEVTGSLARSFGLRPGILPVTDSTVETVVETDCGDLGLQEFWVREKGRPKVLGVRYEGAEGASPSRAVAEAIRSADRIVVCPANPVTSIGPMLAVRGLREALAGARARVTALSPMSGKRPFSGPAAKLMAGTGATPDSAGVAGLYAGFLDAILVDRADRSLMPRIERLGVACRATDARLGTAAAARRVAKELLRA